MSLFKIHCINKTREQFNVFQHYFIIMVPSMQIKGILNVLLTVNHTVVFLDTFQCLPLPYHFYNREYCCWMIICESMKSQAILHVWPSGYGENNFFFKYIFHEDGCLDSTGSLFIPYLPTFDSDEEHVENFKNLLQLVSLY